MSGAGGKSTDFDTAAAEMAGLSVETLLALRVEAAAAGAKDVMYFPKFIALTHAKEARKVQAAALKIARGVRKVKKATAIAAGRKLLGHVGVDSGQLIITDPCYVSRGFDYMNLCDEEDGAIAVEENKHPLIVKFSDFGGDGRFPVYLTETRNGIKLEIEFVGRPF